MSQLDLLDHLPTGCVVIDQRWTIIYWNRMMEGRTGRLRNDLLGEDVLKAFPKLQTPRYLTRITQTMAMGTPSLFAPLLNEPLFQYDTTDELGGRRFEQAIVTRIKLGEESVLLFTLTDVTEQHRRGERFREETRRATREANARREREAELEEAKASAEAATRAKSLFLAAMSHELRTPMNGVLGMADLLMHTELTSQQRENLEILQTSATSLLTVLNDILDFSKIEAQKLVLEEIAYDPRKIVEECVCLIAELAHGKDVECVAYVEPDVPDEVMGDPVRFRQVVTNLLSNAMKFTSTGEIVVHLGVEVEGTELRLECSVRDTGPGMAPEVCSKLFEPFVQASAATTRLHGGTGLGLSICRRLVHLMKGDISVQSELGKGSNFSFHVCVRPRPVDAIRIQRQQRVGILISHDSTARSLRAQLRSIGIRHVEIVSLEDSALDKKLSPLTHVFADLGARNVAEAWATGQRATTAMSLLEPASNPPRAAYLVARTSSTTREAPTSFSGLITLPCRRTALEPLFGVVTPARAAAAKLDISHFGLRVLVADDHRTNQIIARGLLKKMGCEVEVVDDGRAAVDRAMQEPFDLILMDMQMPVLDGCGASLELRNRGYGRPIVALSASVLPEDRQQCLASGMDDFLAKPIERRELLKTLTHWKIRREQQLGGSTPPTTLEPEEEPPIVLVSVPRADA